MYRLHHIAPVAISFVVFVILVYPTRIVPLTTSDSADTTFSEILQNAGAGVHIAYKMLGHNQGLFFVFSVYELVLIGVVLFIFLRGISRISACIGYVRGPPLVVGFFIN